MVSLIPLAITAILVGSGALVWYFTLSDEDKRLADELANNLASELFNKALDQVSRKEARMINQKVKEKFFG